MAMRTEQITNKTEVIEFDSLKEFYDYCVTTPFNEAFKDERQIALKRLLTYLNMAGKICLLS